MLPQRGLLIALEGTDKVGKSTQREKIGKFFEEAGFRVVYTREPGGTPLGEKLRDFLFAERARQGQDFSDLAEALIFFAARDMHLREVIVPALERGDVVITDRYVDSSFAYQAAGGGVPVSTLNHLTDWVCGDVFPDMTFLLTATHATKLARASRDGRVDAMEAKGQEYYDRADAAYLELANERPDSYSVIDANVEIEQVWAQIMPVLMDVVNNYRKRPEPVVVGHVELHGQEPLTAEQLADRASGIWPTAPATPESLFGSDTISFRGTKAVTFKPQYCVSGSKDKPDVPYEPTGQVVVEYTASGLEFRSTAYPFWVIPTEPQPVIDTNVSSALFGAAGGNVIDIMIVSDDKAIATHYYNAGDASIYPIDTGADEIPTSYGRSHTPASAPHVHDPIDILNGTSKIAQATIGEAVLIEPGLAGRCDHGVEYRQLNDGRHELHMVILAEDPQPLTSAKAIASVFLRDKIGIDTDGGNLTDPGEEG